MEPTESTHSGFRSAGSRYTRFEPVTLRAAARVLCLARSGAIHTWEEDAYLLDLLSLDRFARRTQDWDALRKTARRLARLGNAGAPPVRGMRRRTASVAA